MRTLASLPLTPIPDKTADALAWLKQLAEEHGWPRNALFKLSLCMDEALTNVIMHGQFPSGEGRILLLAFEDPRTIGVEIVDDGAAFDPTAQDSPPLAGDLDGARIGGQGLRLMRHFLRDLHYVRQDGHNRLRLMMSREEKD